jgi:DNA-binding IclR family transcriptional regulator
MDGGEPAGRGEDAKGGRTRLSSVATAIRLLKAFGVEDRELGISELAKRLGVSKSTVHRLASTLLSEGLLEQNPETDRYRLGVTLFTLGTMVRRRMDLTAEAKIHLNQLRAEVEENVRLAHLDGDKVLYIYDFESPHAVRLRSQTGLTKPAYCTAEGLVLLAMADGTTRARALAGPFEPAGPNAATDAAAVAARIEEVQRQGWAFEDEESEIGMRCVAAPVRAVDGRAMAAISIAGPRARIRKRMLPQLVSRLIATAEQISARFGQRA